MKAMHVKIAEQGPILTLVELQKPGPGLGEILIRVHAAGVSQTVMDGRRQTNEQQKECSFEAKWEQ